jgi:cobalamin biosynthetic protein CobC
MLRRAGLKLLGGTDLFGLFEASDGIDLLDRFARAGILIRGFAAAPRRYRFGLPADEAAWRRLEAACATLAA